MYTCSTPDESGYCTFLFFASQSRRMQRCCCGLWVCPKRSIQAGGNSVRDSPPMQPMGRQLTESALPRPLLQGKSVSTRNAQ